MEGFDGALPSENEVTGSVSPELIEPTPRRARVRVRPTTEEGDQLRHERDMALAGVEIEKLRTSDQVARVAELEARLSRWQLALYVAAPVSLALGVLLGRLA